MNFKASQSRQVLPTAVSGGQTTESRPGKPSRLRMICYFGFPVLLLLLASPKPNILNILFPLFAFVAAWAILQVSAEQYLTFIFWLWFLTPLLRRIADARSVSSASGTLLLASYLASCVPLYHLVCARTKVLDRDSAPLFYSAVAVLYGALVGFTHYRSVLVAQTILTWLAPLTFSFFIYQNRFHFDRLFAAFERVMVWGTLVVGAYGVIQYFFLPPWDVAWMLNLHNATFGAAKARELRVFSTMNAPQILGIFLGAGILVALHSKHRMRFVAVPFGVISLAFTMARSAWMAFLVGFIYLVFKGSFRLRMQVLVVVIASVLGMGLALQDPTVAKTVSKRFSTLSDVNQDGSFISRIEGHQALFEGIFSQPFGFGLGGVASGTPMSKEDTIEVGGKGVMQSDSTIAAVLIPFGFPGTLLVTGALLIVCIRMMFIAAPTGSPTETLKMLLLVSLIEIPLDDIVNGPSGFLFWTIIGFGLAALSQPVAKNVLGARANFEQFRPTYELSPRKS